MVCNMGEATPKMNSNILGEKGTSIGEGNTAPPHLINVIEQLWCLSSAHSYLHVGPPVKGDSANVL